MLAPAQCSVRPFDGRSFILTYLGGFCWSSEIEAMRDDGTVRVLVVGAGFAGLACADRLSELGHEIVVFEARDRVGGRVWSQQLVPGDPGTVVERGAEFVLDGYTVFRAFAGRLHLPLADTGMSYYVREPRGGAPTTPTAMAEAGRALAERARTVPRSMSLLELAARVDIDRVALDACITRIALSCAYPAGLLSAHAALEDSTQIEAKPSFRLAGGNQGIALRLADRLGSRMHINTPVVAIAVEADQVRVRSEPAELTGDAVVIAVPAATTTDIAIEPPLPEWKVGALSRIGLGQAAKMHVRLAEPAPFSAVIDTARGYWSWTAAGPDCQPQRIVHSFAGSAPVLADLGVGKCPDDWFDALKRLRPELAVEGAALLTTWSDDPWAKMAYSAMSIHLRADDSDLLSRRVGRIFFAGEHTAGPWAGLMEGALRSGLRAAQQVDEALSLAR